MKILVVDDEPVIRRVVAQGLEFCGQHRVVTARDAAEALELADLVNPDLVVTDVDMPGKSGIQLAVELHKLNAGLPVIVMSGRDVFDSRERLLLNGHATRVLSKPVSLEYLARIVDEVRVAA